ncbi:MAG: CCA tRNA nucleotidyltransferase [Oscillospiraceae bacterium]|jgi:tRNA nucleotidyltransferase/poly(A) polymerase|nr:CCA tRNA nucleotidyltransferase [Oscillospiraceae bacterium]
MAQPIKPTLTEKIPAPIKSALALLRRAGFCTYPVGGAVRDLLLGLVPKDWDIATSARPADIIRVFSCEKYRIDARGEKFGGIHIKTAGADAAFEVTTFRREADYRDLRRPETVEFADTAEQDSHRRDFTVNALYLAPSGEVLDYHGGLADLNARVIRTIGEPVRRFSEDSLRMFRAVRFCAQLDFSLEEKTREAIILCADGAAAVTPGRVCEELTKYLAAKINIAGDSGAFSALPYKARRDALLCAMSRAFGIPAPQLAPVLGLSARRLAATDKLFLPDEDYSPS